MCIRLENKVDMSKLPCLLDSLQVINDKARHRNIFQCIILFLKKTPLYKLPCL